MNTLRLTVIAIALAITLPLAVLPYRAMAQDAAKPTTITLQVSPALDDHGHAIAGQYRLAATVTTADGRFVANSPVQFIENVDFFGRRSASLGSAVTDGTGYAAVTYQPSQSGSHTLIARFSGNKLYAASDATSTLDATDVVPPFTTSELPLASVGRWLAIFMAFLGVAFWIVLLGVLGRTVWRIRSEPVAADNLAPAGGRE